MELEDPMNKRIIYLGCLALLPILGGCATTGVKPTNPAVMRKFDEIDKRTMATVVIYRESNFAGSALRPTVMLDGQDFVNVGKTAGFSLVHFVRAITCSKWTIRNQEPN